MKCKWYAEFEGTCTNGDCPYRGDVCPTSERPEVCRYAEEKKPKPEMNAEELVTALRICAGRTTTCEGCPCGYIEESDGGCNDYVKRQAADMLEKLAAEKGTQKPEWISVKDRLPEAGKILVTDGETVTISNGAWLYRSLEEKTRVPANYGAGLTVTHWMPLPKPPKEEESHE